MTKQRYLDHRLDQAPALEGNATMSPAENHDRAPPRDEEVGRAVPN